MEHTTLILTRTLILAASVCAFSFGASHAYGSDEAAAVTENKAQIWVYEKTAVSERPQVIRKDKPLPTVIIPLNTDMQMGAIKDEEFIQITRDFTVDTDFRDFDLVDDSPVFIGTSGATEFDTRDAQRDSGAYPEAMGVDPLYTVAGAGVSTSF